MEFTLPERKQWLALFLLSLGYATIYLDMTALNVALPSIADTFTATSTQQFWIINAYIVTAASFALAGGRLGDILGQRNIFLMGVALFSLTSIGCALSNSASALIVWRAIKGVGGAFTIASSLACIYQIFPREKQGKASGYFGMTSVLFIVLGPLVGGFFTEYLSWRWVFWMNPIFGIISCGSIAYLLRGLDYQRDRSSSFDILGQVLLVGFIVPTIIGLMQAQKWGWTSKSIVNLFLVGIVFFVLFLIVEKRQKHPLFDFRLFKNNNFKLSIILFFCSQFTVVSNVLFALYLEKCLHYRPTLAGIALLPNAFFGFFGNPLAGNFIDKYGVKRVIQVGLLGAALAFVWLAFTASTLTYTCMFISLLIISVALPLYMVGNFVMAMQSAGDNKKGMVAGISMTTRQTGGAFAVALMTLTVTFFEQKYESSLSAMETFTKGYSAAMLLIAFALFVAFYASIWIGSDEKEPELEEETEEQVSAD